MYDTYHACAITRTSIVCTTRCWDRADTPAHPLLTRPDPRAGCMTMRCILRTYTHEAPGFSVRCSYAAHLGIKSARRLFEGATQAWSCAWRARMLVSKRNDSRLLLGRVSWCRANNPKGMRGVSAWAVPRAAREGSVRACIHACHLVC
jgi:hypothetical protein